MAENKSEKDVRIRTLATEFYRKEKSNVLKNGASKKMKEVFNSNPDVFMQKNGWMDSAAMDRFGDEVYVATIIDALEHKAKDNPAYQINAEEVFSRMNNPTEELRQIFVERLCESFVPAVKKAGLHVEEKKQKAEAEKAEVEAKEKRIRHMNKQGEILEKAEALVSENSFGDYQALSAKKFVSEMQNKIVNRELTLWTDLYKMYNKNADDKLAISVCDRLLSRFANSYIKENQVDSFANVPEDEIKSWVGRFHENSLYMFGQIAQRCNESEKKDLSTKAFVPNLSAEMYRRYPEYEAETLAEMPVVIYFVRGAGSEIAGSGSGYRYLMNDSKVFIIPSDIVQVSSEFNGYVIEGTRGWVRSYVLYAADGSGTATLADIEADAVVKNSEFYETISKLLSKV